MKNVNNFQLRKCILLNYDKFSEVLKNAFGKEIRIHNCLEGLSYDDMSSYENVTRKDVNEKLSAYFDVIVTSVHSDNYEPTGIWICYK